MDWKGKGLNKMKESERFMFFLARARMPFKKCFRRRLKRKVENAMDSEEQENKKRIDEREKAIGCVYFAEIRNNGGTHKAVECGAEYG